MWLEVSNGTLAGEVSLHVVHANKGLAAGSVVGEAMGCDLQNMLYMIRYLLWTGQRRNSSMCGGCLQYMRSH